ncbi:MAG TPA: hypothetical protein VFF29_07095, partial [Bacteroidota bacterium]|nr:hypothetical protein [Bacteroidota bacterium]
NTDIEVEHLRSYTLRSFIRNEFTRSAGFAELATQLGESTRSLRHGFANVYPSFVASTILSIILLFLLSSYLMGWAASWYLGIGAGIYFILNIRFLNYLEQVRGLFAMMVMVPILFLDHLVCFLGSVVGVVKGLLTRS